MLNRKTTPPILAAACLVAVLAVAAGPSDGASSLPITTCGQTVTTNAVLTQNLDCAGPGIVVGAAGITVDLDGHALDGSAGDVGIQDLSGYDGVTIKNGVVRNFSTGVSAVNGADHVTVSNVVAAGNVLYGIEIGGNSASIRSTTASENGGSGVRINGDSASIKSATAAGNGGSGAWLDGNGISVKSTTASGNGGYGLLLHGQKTSVVSSSASGNNTGLQITGDSALVKSTTASGNEAYGILIYGDGAKLKGNRAEANGFFAGASDGNGLGISVPAFTVAPTGTNAARGNDDPADCQPVSLCPKTTSQSVKAGFTPITTCGQVVKTNAALTQDLDCPNMGIYVDASGITVDLNGHVLKGSGNSYGVIDLGFDDVAVENGVIRNFSGGVDALNVADNVTVSNVVVAGNLFFGISVFGNAPSVESSVASGNGSDGVHLAGAGASVTSTTAAGNGEGGVFVADASASIVSTTTAGNAGKGVFVSGDTSSVKSSSAFGNGSIGVEVDGHGASVTSTNATGNATTTPGNWAQGILVAGDATTISGNRAEGNGFASGVSDGLGLGIEATNFTTPPVGTNGARGNDNAGECAPASLC